MWPAYFRGCPPRLAFLLPIAACGASAAHAQSILISPVDPVIEPEQRAAALWLENRGDKPAVLQIQILGWRQVDGEDAYDKQTDLVASPPAIKVAPGVRQLVRLIATNANRPAAEAAYRVVIDQLPVTLPEAEAAAPGGGVRFRMRYSLPLFLYGDSARKRDAATERPGPPLRCTIVDSPGGGKLFQISNQGTIHARLSKVLFGTASVATGLLGYVLPGQSLARPVPGGEAASAPLRVTVNDDREPRVLHCDG